MGHLSYCIVTTEEQIVCRKLVNALPHPSQRKSGHCLNYKVHTAPYIPAVHQNQLH